MRAEVENSAFQRIMAGAVHKTVVFRAKLFRICTYTSVSKQRTYNLLAIRTYEPRFAQLH
jgi:hypothetical protein